MAPISGSKVDLDVPHRSVVASSWLPMFLACAVPAVIALASRAMGGPAPVPAGAHPAGDWSCFRGPGGMGVSDAKGLPVSWSDTQGIAWKTALPGPGASSPIVFKDRAYVTCYTGYLIPGQPGGSLEQLKRHLIAVRLSDGGILWNQAVAAKLPEESQIRDHGYASSTPVADAERVYVFFGKSGVFAFDHEGKQVWQADVGSKTCGWGSAASPVLYGDLVIVNASVESESLVALDRKTGQETWRVSGIKQSWNAPVLVSTAAGKTELVLGIMGKVLGFDPPLCSKMSSAKSRTRRFRQTLITRSLLFGRPRSFMRRSFYLFARDRSFSRSGRAQGRTGLVPRNQPRIQRFGQPLVHDSLLSQRELDGHAAGGPSPRRPRQRPGGESRGATAAWGPIEFPR